MLQYASSHLCFFSSELRIKRKILISYACNLMQVTCMCYIQEHEPCTRLSTYYSDCTASVNDAATFLFSVKKGRSSFVTFTSLPGFHDAESNVINHSVTRAILHQY